jgi:hypothetical protein
MKNRTSIPRTSCAPWCSPKKHMLCGSPICCPHLYTGAESNNRAGRGGTR